ncbi:hypothetical protein AAMO2058_001192200 [Amorphochlora amoebiformis]
MFDPMLFSSTIGQFGLGPSSETFNASNEGAPGPLFGNDADEMRLSGPPDSSETISMSAHRSLFPMRGSASSVSNGGGLKRSMSSAVLSDLSGPSEFFYEGETVKKEEKIGKLKKIDEDPEIPKPLGLRSSSSCPNLQQLTDQDSGNDATDKIKKRKARKAEVARQCRKRKKAYIQSLEEKAKHLAEQLSALSNKRHKSGGSMVDHQTQHRNDQQRLLDKMQKLIDRSHGEDVGKELKSCINSFTTNSRRRQKATVSQMQNLKSSIDPTIDTKFALWLLHQGGPFCNTEVWKALNREVKLTKTQLSKLQANRTKALEIQTELHRLNQQIEVLQKQMQAHLQRRHEVLDQITSKILHPKQTSRLLLWVQQNPSCMEVLNTVWKTQIVAKEEKVRGRSERASRRSAIRAKKEMSPLDLLPKGDLV